MNYLNLLTKSYALCRNYDGVPYWIMTPFRRLIRGIANVVLPKYLAKPHTINNNLINDDVIISFTSFPARINNVWQVVECMFRQTLQPAKILLWLSKEQFPTQDSVPQSLRDREGDIFEIHLVDGDIRSHKKYYYVSKEYPDSLIFLIDDDLYYSPDILERSCKALVEHPKTVICNYGTKMTYKGGKLQSHDSWLPVNRQTKNVFFGSGGGTLFSPVWLYQDLTDIETARHLTPTADDVWLNAMVRLNKVPILMLDNGPLFPVKNDDDVKLCAVNNGQGQNDIQIAKINEYYYNKLGTTIF